MIEVPENWLKADSPSPAIAVEFLSEKQGREVIGKALFYAIKELEKDKETFRSDLNVMKWLVSCDLLIGHRRQAEKEFDEYRHKQLQAGLRK